MLFDWDRATDEQTRLDRGFGFDFASLIFEADTLERRDGRVDYGEVRIVAIGDVDGLVLSVVYTDRSDVRRIISARMAKRKEREEWHAC